MGRGLGLALAAALGVALFVIAYLLGRESARTRPAVAALTPVPAVPGSAHATSVAAPAAPAPEAPATSSDAPTATSAPPAGDTTTRDEVARYFAEVETLQRTSKAWTGDPQAAAQQMVQDAMRGDTGGMETLLEANRKLAASLRAVSTPAPCAEHMQKTLETLEASDRLLTNLTTAMKAQDIGGLAQATAAGQDVERRAREVDALAADIKRRYGL